MSESHEPSNPTLGEGHVAPLKGLDVFMGGFCIVSFLIATGAWYQGYTSFASPMSILIFLITNVAISQVSFRARRPLRVEIGRAIAGAVIAPGTFVFVDGSMQGWWPGFLIMCLGGCIILGLLTQKPFMGAALVLYYGVLLFITGTTSHVPVSNYAMGMNIGVIAMVGLTFSQTMSLLGQSLHKEYLQRLELKKAKDALFAEMEVAQEIQTLLLPQEPKLPNATIIGKMQPASEVGGDYYDVITTSQGRHFLAIGDVSGHGVTSGLTMMMARASLVGALESIPSATLPQIYQVINQCLRQNLARMNLEMYMTFVLVEYKNDGHCIAVGKHLPLLIHRSNNTIEEISLQGAWLGIVDHINQNKIPVQNFTLNPGDRLILYTDGSIEHENPQSQTMYGEERLKSLIQTHKGTTATHLIQDIFSDLQKHHTNFADDVTFLILERV